MSMEGSLSLNDRVLTSDLGDLDKLVYTLDMMIAELVAVFCSGLFSDAIFQYFGCNEFQPLGPQDKNMFIYLEVDTLRIPHS